ncbi:MAG: GntR family transcriptional regulator [Acetivibrionales bacterium]
MKKKKSNSEKAYEYLKNEIVSMKMPQGTQVNEQEIANKLGISRTPVREAMRKLEAQGLLTSFPFHGTIVSKITLEDITEICELRELIELWAIRKSINRFKDSELNEIEDCMKNSIECKNWKQYHDADKELHTLIVEKTGSSRAMHILDMLNTPLERFRKEAQNDFLSWNTSLNEHLKIIELIRNRNYEECVPVLEKHLKRVKNLFIEAMYTMKVSNR